MPLGARAVEAERFLAALGDPAVQVRCSQAGFNRLQASWVVKPRAIPEHHAYLIAQSTLHGRVLGRRLRLGPGQLVWLMPGVLHEFWIEPSAPPSLYHLKVEVAPRGSPPLRLERDVIHVGEASALRPAFDLVVQEWTSREPFAPARLRAALTLLLSGALRSSGRSDHDGPVLDARSRERLERLVDRRIGERIPPAALARELGLNADYFARVFRRTYGLPPKTWLVRRRMHAAAARLRESDAAIVEIAHAFGYPDVFLFSRQFKQAFGRSPTAYRGDP